MHHSGLRRQRAFHKKKLQQNKKIQLTLKTQKNLEYFNANAYPLSRDEPGQIGSWKCVINVASHLKSVANSVSSLESHHRGSVFRLDCNTNALFMYLVIRSKPQIIYILELNTLQFCMLCILAFVRFHNPPRGRHQKCTFFLENLENH